VSTEDRALAPGLPRRPLRHRLAGLIALALAVTAAVAATVHHFEQRAQDRIFEELLDSRSRQCRRSLEEFLQPTYGFLSAIGDWTTSGVLDLSRPDELTRQLLPLIQRSERLSRLIVAQPPHFAWRLRREEGAWGETAIALADSVLEKEPWYRGVRDERRPKEVFWIESPELVAALSWDDPTGSRPFYAALVFAHEAAERLHRDLAVTPHSTVAIVNDEGMVSWLAAGGDGLIHSVTLSRLVHSPDEQRRLLAQALLVWNDAGRPFDRSVPFRRSREAWRLRAEPLKTMDGSRVMVLLLPRRDLQEQLHALSRPYLFALAATLLLGAAMVAAVYLGYRRRLRSLRRRHDHQDLGEEELRALIDRGESDALEFKSTLRWNLKTNKPGREIEKAWLKTVVAFLNTEGGTLLIGVADDGEIVGIGRDGFRNEDKYLLHFNNCVKQNIGLEFARFLSFGLKAIEGEKILVVDVEPADEPAFLIIGEDEEFYVRVGPASRKVSPKQALEFLRGRS